MRILIAEDDQVLADGLLRALERPDLGADARFGKRMDRVHNHEALVEALRPVFLSRPRAHWLRRCASCRVAPASSCRSSCNPFRR